MARKNLEWCDNNVIHLKNVVERDGSVNFYAQDDEHNDVIHLYRRQPVEALVTKGCVVSVTFNSLTLPGICTSTHIRSRLNSPSNAVDR